MFDDEIFRSVLVNKRKDVSNQVSCICFYCTLSLSERVIGEYWILDPLSM